MGRIVPDGIEEEKQKILSIVLDCYQVNSQVHTIFLIFIFIYLFLFFEPLG